MSTVPSPFASPSRIIGVGEGGAVVGVGWTGSVGSIVRVGGVAVGVGKGCEVGLGERVGVEALGVADWVGSIVGDSVATAS